MTKLEWLESRLRSIRLVRSNGEDEREGMFVGTIALWGFDQRSFEVHSLDQLIETGVAAENRSGRVRVEVDGVEEESLELRALHRDRKKLAALVQSGVRKWEHFDAAMKMVEEEQ